MSGEVKVETQFQIAPQFQSSELEAAAPQYYFIQTEGPDSQQTEVS